MAQAQKIGQRILSAARIAVMLGRSGLWRPGPPDRVVRQVVALRHWGTALGGTFISAAARDPDRPAIVDEYGTLTYAQVNARTNRLAVSLGEGGRKPGVAVLCRNHRGLVETLLACSKLGSDVVLLNTGMSAEQSLKVLDDQQVDVLIVDSEFSEVRAGARISTFTADGPESELAGLIAAGIDTDLRPPDRPGRTVVLSSGTTGTPKGAKRQGNPGLSPLAAMLARIPLRVHETMLIEAPLFHTWGFANLQIAIGLRATMVLRRKFSPVESLRLAERSRATVLVAVPVMLQRILEAGERPELPSLRIVSASGSALSGGFATRFMDAFGDRLYNLYGSTESSWVTIATPGDLRAHPDTAGTPPPGTRLAILDEHGREVPTGTVGQIFAGNELPFEGYTNGAAKEMRDGLMSVGDLGRVDAKGRLFVVGRADDMIVSGGENVFPSEVEDVLTQLPQVIEAAVVGVADEEFGRRLAAYIVLHDDAELSAEEVRDHARHQVARYAVPRDVHFVGSLPRNATGKVVRRHLHADADAQP